MVRTGALIVLLTLTLAGTASASRTVALDADGVFRLVTPGSTWAAYYAHFSDTPAGFKSYGNPPGFAYPIAMATSGEGKAMLFGANGGGVLYTNSGSGWERIGWPVHGSLDAITDADGRIHAVGTNPANGALS